MNNIELVQKVLEDPKLGDLQRENLRQVERKLLSNSAFNIDAAKFSDGDCMVEDGVSKHALMPAFEYAFVPLGIIVSGEVAVHKNGKGTKKLRLGDFVGLFETADFLLTQKKRHIGEWTLTAVGEVTIFLFSSHFFTEPLLPFGQVPHSYNEVLDPFCRYLILLAQKDPVPQPITNLPLLDMVAAHTTDKRYTDYAVITHTHILPNNVPFFRHLAALTGFGKIFLLEKPYSTVTTALHDMVMAGAEVIPVDCDGAPYDFAVKKSLEVLWHRVLQEKGRSFKKLLIVDDGAEVLLSVPWDKLEGVEIVAVEQTQRGINQLLQTSEVFPPTVSVATCGVKKEIETFFIGESIAKRLIEQGYITKKTKVGIVGMGGIGMGVLCALETTTEHLCFYDVKPQESLMAAFPCCSTLDELIQQSDVIIGTTGTDALKGVAFDRIRGFKTFVSASSRDIEFYSLLQLAEKEGGPFATKDILMSNGPMVRILNGGYPMNFDRKGNATPDDEIVLTRALLYIASIQALRFLTSTEKNKIFDLDETSQKELLSLWGKLMNHPYEDKLCEKIVKQYAYRGEKTLSVWTE